MTFARLRSALSFMLLLAALSVVLPACAEKEFDPADPAGSFQTAREPYDDEKWEYALTRLGEFKSRFPYSQYAVEAELLLANTQYEMGRYAEASVAYAQFAKLHPKHTKVDFALYRVGESYWADAPDNADRGQEMTAKAVEAWEELVTRYPNSKYGKKAVPMIEQGKRRIADNFAFVARFYCKRAIYHSCAFKYMRLLELYPQYSDLRKEAAERAAMALLEVAKVKEANPKDDSNIFTRDMSADQIRAKAAELAATSSRKTR
jgi:outer membrane protein assembly factor BamD